MKAHLIIDTSPPWLKQSYIMSMRAIRWMLNHAGLLAVLDTKSKEDKTFHYWRSLLAIHDLADMLKLDVPWWTYSATDFLIQYLQHLSSPITVFEWGSGASTVWLAKRVSTIRSVEHDPQWYVLLQSFVRGHAGVQLMLREPERTVDIIKCEDYASQKMPGWNFKHYVTAIEDYPDRYDIIVIDGRSRQACLQACIPFLKEEGIIIFDNADRAEYQKALLQSGLVVTRFPGKVPASPFRGETAILSFSKLPL